MTYPLPDPLKKYPFIKLLLPLLVGILLQWYLQFDITSLLFTSAFFVLILLIFAFLSVAKKFTLRWLHGCIILVLFAMLGCIITYTNDIRHQKEWIGNIYSTGNKTLVTLDEPLIEKDNSYKAIVTVNAVDTNGAWINAKGKVLVYFEKSDWAKKLTYGSQIILNKPLQQVTNSGNPGAFDYRRYCLFQGITHQVFVQQQECSVLKNKNTNRLWQKIYSAQTATINTLQQNILGGKEQGVAEALLIGYRNDLDKDLVQAYSNTGVVHIIAISGLHIGMIYAFMVFILSPFKRYKWFVWISPVIILFVLWSFTLIAGAAPSILRSSVMFTFIVMGKTINRKTNIYNTLAASAFCMLVYNPFMLWDVGFILSYAAVISIITFAPPIYRHVYFRNKILDKVWAAASVTIAAQILTLPIVIFYFHQLPVYFLITNLLVVPLSALILFGEIFLLCISLVGPVASFSGHVIQWFIWFMNSFIEYMNTLPFAVWKNLQINVIQTWLLYGFIILLCIWLLRKYSKAFVVSLAFLTAFTISVSFETIIKNRQQKLIVYNISKQSAIDIIQGTHYQFIGDYDLSGNSFPNNFHLKPARILLHANSRESDTAQYSAGYILKMENTSIVILDNSFHTFSSANKVPVDVLVVSKNPSLKIAQIQQQFDCKEIVFDSSNPLWKIERWKKDCDSLHLRFHSVPEQGAFVMDIAHATKLIY